MIHSLFNWCVNVLEDGARLLGMSYEAINIWIFCVIEPIAFLLMLLWILRQRRQIRKLKDAVSGIRSH